MLLSKSNLETLRQEQENGPQESKLDRIIAYINDQSEQFPYNGLPNSQTNVSIPESCKSDDKYSYAISASISDIIRRKCAQPTVDSPVSQMKEMKKRLYTQSSSNHGHKRVKQSSKEEHAGATTLPISKSNGFHLLQKFVSPNLEIDRITMKSNHHHSQPKIGLFNKGKSSAHGKSVPELVFSEEKFLKKQYESLKPMSKAYEVESHVSRHPSISKYFQKNPLTSIQSSRMSNYTQSHFQKPSPSHTVPHNTSFSTTASPAYQNPALSSRLSSSVYFSVTSHRPRYIQDIFAKQQMPSAVINGHRPSQILENRTQPENNDKHTSLSSCITIQNLFKECRNTPSFELKHNNYHGIQQTPTYARVRTPNLSSVSPSAISCLHEVTPESPRMNSSCYRQTSASPSENSSLYIYCQNPSLKKPKYQKNKPDQSDPEMRNKQHKKPLDLNWQLEDSILSFDSNEEQDDFNAIMNSPAVHLLDKTIQQSDDNIQKFLQTRSYKRRL